MEQIQVEMKRNTYASAKEARNDGQIPMIYYGKGIEPLQMTAEYQEFRRAYLKAGKSSIITLSGEGAGKQALVHEIQHDPVTDQISHVDLMAVQAGQNIHTEVPLVFIGEAPAVKELGAIFVSNKDYVSIECLPKALVHDIQVDISGLKSFHDKVTVADLKLPAGIKVLDSADITLAMVSTPQKEDESAVVSAPEAAPVAEKKE